MILLGCKQHLETRTVKVILSADHRSINIIGFDRAVIAEIGRDSSDEAWESLLPVYKLPADTDLKDFQPYQPGHYQVKDSLVIFKPDTLFAKGRTYFLRSYDHAGTDAWSYIKDKRRPGSA